MVFLDEKRSFFLCMVTYSWKIYYRNKTVYFLFQSEKMLDIFQMFLPKKQNTRWA